jgi:hypothetical protein
MGKENKMSNPDDNVVIFPRRNTGSVNWQVLCLGNAARTAALALACVVPAASQLTEDDQARVQLAADAADLCRVLARLAEQLDGLRQNYL